MHEAEFFRHRKRKKKQLFTYIVIRLAQQKREACASNPSNSPDGRSPPHAIPARAWRKRMSTPWGPIERGGRHSHARLRPSAFQVLITAGSNSVSPPAEQCDQCSVEENVYQ